MKAPAFQFYVRDWLSSGKVATMTLEQQGAYMRLLCFAWLDDDCSLPNDDAELASLSGMGERWFTNGSQVVRRCFTEMPNNPSRLVNERLVVEREKQAEWRKKSAEGGRKSGKTRRLAKRTNAEAKTNQTTNQKPTLLSAVCSLQNNPLPPCLEANEEFVAAWQKWIAHVKAVNRKVTPYALELQLQKCEKWGPVWAATVIRHSIEHNWKGLFAPKEGAPDPQAAAKAKGVDKQKEKFEKDLARSKELAALAEGFPASIPEINKLSRMEHQQVAMMLTVDQRNELARAA